MVLEYRERSHFRGSLILKNFASAVWSRNLLIILANKRNAQKTQNLLNKANLRASSLILTPPVEDPEVELEDHSPLWDL